MKSTLQKLLYQAFAPMAAQKNSALVLEEIHIEHTSDKKFGDFTSNIALVFAKKIGLPPRELAAYLCQHILHPMLIKTEIAGPGFINFFVNAQEKTHVLRDILSQKDSFGCSTLGAGKLVHIEYVSANPTGPLHVGHGRSAAFGAAVANLLTAVGYRVHREYYVNDAGRQMHILATSVWLRYLALWGETLTFPSNGYHGDYVIALARDVYNQYGNIFLVSAEKVFQGVALDEGQPNGDKEAHIDGLIDAAKKLLAPHQYQEIFSLAKNTVLADIKDDLSAFRVSYEDWFSEQRLIETNAFAVALHTLQQKQAIYTAEGAVWFKASAFGDEKDRVLIKENGERTYFANDIAYHVHKYQRGYDQVIDVFGADHHGYVPRIQAVLKALGYDTSNFTALLVQFAILYRGEQRVQMSTRSGSFVTLRELQHEVGVDAARFFYVMRKNEQHMNFDLALAKSQNNENPVYYIQYAHARICSVFRQCAEKSIEHSIEQGLAHLALLTAKEEVALLDQLLRYAGIIEAAAQSYEPHLLANYLRTLAHAFHVYYHALSFMVEDSALRAARLNIILATQQVLRNGLTMLGVVAVEKM